MVALWSYFWLSAQEVTPGDAWGRGAHHVVLGIKTGPLVLKACPQHIKLDLDPNLSFLPSPQRHNV